jgi:hypothetical protein
MIDALFSRRTLVRTLPSLAALGALPGAGQALAQDTNPPSNPPAGAAAVALGMMVEVVEDRTQLDAAIEQIGRPLEIVMFHTHWGTNSGVFEETLFQYIDERGAIPLVTWEAWVPIYAGGVAVAEQPTYALKNIVAGDFDAYIDRWATGLAEWGKPALLRFGHEMNGDWYPWAAGANGNTAQDFIDAWIYLHDRFVAAGAENVYWVWSPMASASAASSSILTPLDEVFPGDEYVDFVGASGFNWGETPQPWGVAGWETFSDIFEGTYAELKELSAKPVVITETASAELGGDKGAWITSAFLTEIPEAFPDIVAVVWFNVIKETDWRIDSSVESLRAFVTAANSPAMLGDLVFA